MPCLSITNMGEPGRGRKALHGTSIARASGTSWSSMYLAGAGMQLAAPMLSNYYYRYKDE